MTKQELAAKIAQDLDISKAAANKAIDSLIGGISMSLKRGEKVTFVGFGTFSVVHKKARQGRNPKTGQPITIKARKAAKFKPGAKLVGDIQ
jgi:DNA-binding protein HU-beta